MGDQEQAQLASRLKEAREEQGLTQRELAEKAGLTASAVSQFEGGKREPSFNSMVKLARALEVSPSYLSGLEEYDVDPEIRAMFREFSDLDEADLDLLRTVAAGLRKRSEESDTDA